jgi:hypothetical protein
VAAPGLRSVRSSECPKPQPKPRRKYQEMFLRKSLISTLISDNSIFVLNKTSARQAPAQNLKFNGKTAGRRLLLTLAGGCG